MPHLPLCHITVYTSFGCTASSSSKHPRRASVLCSRLSQLVGTRGIEPPRLATRAPRARASAISATCRCKVGLIGFEPICAEARRVLSTMCLPVATTGPSKSLAEGRRVERLSPFGQLFSRQLGLPMPNPSTHEHTSSREGDGPWRNSGSRGWAHLKRAYYRLYSRLSRADNRSNDR